MLQSRKKDLDFSKSLILLAYLAPQASAVRWGVAGNILWAWVLTIPASAFVAGVAYWISLLIY